MTEDKTQNFKVFAYGSLMDQRFVEEGVKEAFVYIGNEAKAHEFRVK